MGSLGLAARDTQIHTTWAHPTPSLLLQMKRSTVSSGGGDMGPPGLPCVAGGCVTWRSHAGKPHTLAQSQRTCPGPPLQSTRGRLLSTKRLSEDVHGGLFIGGVKRNQPLCAHSACTQATVCVFSWPPPGVRRPGPLVHLCRRLSEQLHQEKLTHVPQPLVPSQEAREQTQLEWGWQAERGCPWWGGWQEGHQGGGHTRVHRWEC